jgi:putative heme transporter
MRRLRQWMSVVVFAVLIAALAVRRDDLGAAFAEIGRLDAAWYVLLASLIAVGIVVDGVYTQSVTPQLSIARAIMVQQAATASNNTVIGSGPVATGLRIAMMRSWDISDASIAVSILALNVIAAYRLWLIAFATSIAGLAGADGGVLDTRVYVVVVVVASVVLSGSTLLWWVLLRHPIVAARIAGLVQRAWDRLRGRVVRLPDIGIVAFTAQSHEEALDLVRLRRWRILVAVVADQAITIAKPLAVVRAFGIGSDELSTWQVLIAYGLVRLVVALTPIPGGIGVTELGLAALLVRFGGDEAVVLAAVLTYRALTFALPIVTGGICFLAWRFEHRRPANEHLCSSMKSARCATDDRRRV